MRANIRKVIAAFKEHKAAKGDSKGTCWTDGATIFSYRMPIAWWSPTDALFRSTTDPVGQMETVVVVPYEDGPTRTTKSQISACQFELLPRKTKCDKHEDCKANDELATTCFNGGV